MLRRKGLFEREVHETGHIYWLLRTRQRKKAYMRRWVYWCEPLRLYLHLAVNEAEKSEWFYFSAGDRAKFKDIVVEHLMETLANFVA